MRPGPRQTDGWSGFLLGAIWTVPTNKAQRYQVEYLHFMYFELNFLIDNEGAEKQEVWTFKKELNFQG